jgi:hypothetical protein
VRKSRLGGILGRFYRHSRLAVLEQYIRASGKRNAVFIWIPKTAGTSVFNALEANGCQKLKAPHHVKDYFPQKGLVTFGHMSYLELLSHHYVSRQFDDTAFKFCFTRNPYSRAVSLFSYLKRIGRIPADTSFLSFCRTLDEKGCEPIGLFNARGLSQCNPQVRWIENINIDFTGKLESLEEDLKNIMALLDLHSVAAPHLNATPHKDDREYYCDESRAIVREFYREDFRLLDYKTDEG